MEFNQFSEKHFDESITISEIIEKYMIHIKWFILSVLLFGVLAFLKVRYETPSYNVKASILIKEQERGNSISDLSAFEDMGLFGMSNNNLQNEMQILNSRYLMTSVVKELKLNYRFFIEDSPYDREQYPNFPINVSIKSDSSSIDRSIASSFKVFIKSDRKFEFFNSDGNSKGVKTFGEDFYADLGNEIISDKRKINIAFNKSFNSEIIGNSIIVFINPINHIVNNYMERLTVEPVDERMSDVITLSLDETVKEKGIALINNLIEQYNADAINDKNEVAKTTTKFLDSRIELISTELVAIEATAEQFKTKNRMVDTNAGAEIFLQSSSVNESELIAANTELELANYMLEKLTETHSGELLPGNIGLSDPSVISMISDYNNLVLQRKRILKSSSTINPIIVNIDSQLSVLKSNLTGSLNTLHSALQIQINALSRQSGRISSRIASVPKNEREFRDIVRQQEVKNTLYLFLLQKREESILSNAVSINKAKVIDKAFSSGNKVSPKKMANYLGGILLGFLIPFLIIYVKDLMDTKVHDENDVKKLRIPYLGDVPLSASNKDLFISDGDNSNIAEAFRYVRTNINFILDSKDIGKTVFITSTQSHEGKTFTAINLASSLAISGKKTLLLAMDLRAPMISKYLGIEDMLGVTNFIKNSDLQVSDIIDQFTKFDNLDIINSGDIPPNPVELLMSKRVHEIFDFVKDKYEYIIVDTAPVGMVTDTIQISNFADMTIYVIKANYLDKRMLHIPEKLHKEKKLPNMAILINGSDHSKGAYGYGYGYGNKKEKPWHKRIF